MTNGTTNYRLGINTGFAVNRYSEPEQWVGIVGQDLGLRYVQLTADMINPSLDAAILSDQVARIRAACERHGVEISSTFTGAFTRVNHLAHPDPAIRAYWISWFKDFAAITADLGASAMGSHFGIFTHQDNRDPEARAARRRQNIEGWHEIGHYAKQAGLNFLSWEPMSISREQGETLTEARRLQDDVNHAAPLPFRICLDVDHGDLASANPEDTDPYAWLREFAADSPQIHLKQSSANKGGHWPFTAAHNAEGRIVPERVLQTLTANGAGDNTELLLELSFREREPADSTVVEVLRESVDYWRALVRH
jgi:D-erythrulose 1-phosphate 3-epimerase